MASTEGTVENADYMAWLAVQPPMVRAGADSPEMNDFLHVMSMYQQSSGTGMAEPAPATPDPVDEVEQARQTRAAGGKAAPASTGAPKGTNRAARTEEGDFDAGWDDAAQYDDYSYGGVEKYAWGDPKARLDETDD